MRGFIIAQDTTAVQGVRLKEEGQAAELKSLFMGAYRGW